MNQTAKVSERISEARRLIEAGHLAQARKINASILAARPNLTPALLQASRLEGLDGNYRLARDYALRAFNSRKSGQDRGGLAFMMRRLQAFNLGTELMQLIDAVETEGGAPPALMDNIATALNQLNQPERALVFVDKALESAGDSLELRLTRAHTLVFLGRFDEAESEMLACMQRAPHIGFGWWTLARLRKQKPDRHHVDEIRRQISASSQNPANLAFLAYALHKELDDIGDHAGAAQALDLACTTRRGLIDYSTGSSSRLFSALHSMPRPAALSQADEEAFASTRTPIFVVGMHRSGTTLLEQFLDGHSRVRALGELYEFTAQMRLATDHWCKGVIDERLVQKSIGVDFAEVGRGYLDSVEWRCGDESHFVDKLPSNFMNLGFICSALPHARILHMVRDPMESCFSNLRELFAENTNDYSYSRVELAEFFGLYEGMMTHWHALFPGRILDVHYAELTRQPERLVPEIARFCGLEPEPEMLAIGTRERGVTTASAVQVRQGVVALDKPRWTPYSDYLKPLADTLQRVRP